MNLSLILLVEKNFNFMQDYDYYDYYDFDILIFYYDYH